MNTDSGWFSQSGYHPGGNTNYFSGNYFSTGQLNDYFSFDLSGVSGNVTGATLKLETYDINQAGSFTIYGTGLSPAAVNSALTYNDLSKYNALTSGLAIGSISLTPSNRYGLITITLNANGVAFLQSHEGGEMVIGGSFLQPYNPGQESYAFGYSGFTPANDLNIETVPVPVRVPEPASLMLLGAGLAALAARLRRSRAGRRPAL